MSPRDADAILVTGCSTGIGRATALRLDADGFRVFAGVRRDEDACALREGASPRLTALRLDVTRPAEIEAAAERVAEAVRGRGLRGLVNNAGIALGGPLEFLPLDELRRQLEVNAVGVVAVTRAFLPLLRERRGRIVNVSSVAGFLGVPFLGPYCASKFAVEAISEALRLELRPFGVGVSLVQPGATDTPIYAKGGAYLEAELARLPEESSRLYGRALGAVARAQVDASRSAAAPDLVAAAIARALTARRPRARYRVGADALLQLVLARWLPTRVRDRLLEAMLGLRGAG